MTGLHISLLGMGLFNLLKRMGLGNTGAGMLALTVMLQYGMLTGGSVSAMRAVCMFLLSVGAKIIGRSYDLLTALSLSAILLLLDSPAYLYSSSFLLSFGAVAGLGTISPYITEIMGAKKELYKSFLSSFSVQLATLPVMLVFFGEVSVAGILLNLLVLPTVGGVLISGLCSSLFGLFSIKTAVIAAVPGRILLYFYEKGCALAGKLPFCTWTGGMPEIWQCMVYYACLILGMAATVRITGKRRKLAPERAGRRKAVFVFTAAVIAGILVLSFHDRRELRITCLDVGQGDGMVLEMPGGGAFLMDCGSSSQKNTGQYQLLPYLKSRGITYLEGVLISHTDVDHISGIQELLELMSKGLTSVKAGSLILPDWGAERTNMYPEERKQRGASPEDSGAELYKGLTETAENGGIPIVLAKQGDSLHFGEAEMRFLAPEADASGADVNEEGLVMELRYGNFRGLFTGDIGEETEQKLLKTGVFSDVDFLKVAHHGSRYSTGREFLDAVRPEFAVISCSDSNTYGHPSPETVSRLEESGAEVAYTMKSGAVTVYTDGESIRAEGFLPPLLPD